MTKLEKIEKDIASLAPADLHRLADWIAEYRDAQWDKQIEDDVEAGRLDAIAEEVLADHRAGRTRPL